MRPGSSGVAACVDARGGVPKASEDVLAEHGTPSASPGFADVSGCERPLLLLLGVLERERHPVFMKSTKACSGESSTKIRVEMLTVLDIGYQTRNGARTRSPSSIKINETSFVAPILAVAGTDV